jgi:hypothetical protein
MIKETKLRRAELVEGMGERRNIYQFWSENLKDYMEEIWVGRRIVLK